MNIYNSYLFIEQHKKKPEERSRKRARDSSVDTNNSGRKGRGNSVSSDDVKDAKRDHKEEKPKTGFEKGLKAEKIIGKLPYLYILKTKIIKHTCS